MVGRPHRPQSNLAGDSGNIAGRVESVDGREASLRESGVGGHFAGEFTLSGQRLTVFAIELCDLCRLRVAVVDRVRSDARRRPKGETAARKPTGKALGMS
ncbi:MAG: hypothetical protein CMO80_06760 [Verrucomicrobiales bacterium]|nr:hypothetical protein [Verrucomicrobiales bacterium]